MSNTFPLKILDGESQLDRIEKKLDAIMQKLEIEYQDTSREALANNMELADFHGAQCLKNEFFCKVRDYLAKKAKDHDQICIKVLCSWSFDARSTNLSGAAGNKVMLWADEKGNHFNARIEFRDGTPSEISLKRFPLLSDDTGVIADIAQCNFISSLTDAIINHKIEVSDLGDYDISKYRSISEDFDEWWNGLCQIDDTVEGVIHVLKDIHISIDGNETGCFKADPNFPQGIKITRHNDDTADFEFAAFGRIVTANFNLLGRFLYHCIILGEIEIPCFKSWRICKYTGVWPESKQMEKTNGR